MDKSQSDSVKLNKWILHFFLINLLILYVISYAYLGDKLLVKLYYFVGNQGFYDKSNFRKFEVILYLLITYIGYFSLLTLCAFIIPYLVAKLIKKPLLILSVTVLFSSCLFLLVIID